MRDDSIYKIGAALFAVYTLVRILDRLGVLEWIQDLL